MPIHYFLVPHALDDQSNDYVARLARTGSANFEQVADRMVRRGSTVGKADILAVMEDLVAVCESTLLEGQRINLGGLVQLYPRIRGKFDGAQDSFDSSRHRIDVGASPGERLRKVVRNHATTTKKHAPSANPILKQFLDTATGRVGRLTPGGIGTIAGARLKFDPDRDDEGIFLVPSGRREPWQIRRLATNHPKKLVFLVPPDLPPGRYKLEVRNRPRNSTALLSGQLDGHLSVG